MENSHDGAVIRARLQAKLARKQISVGAVAKGYDAQNELARKQIFVGAIPKVYNNGYDAQDVQVRRKMRTKKKHHTKDLPTLTWEDSPHVHDTTLYKAVPYTRILQDAEVNNFLKRLENNTEYEKFLRWDPEDLMKYKVSGDDPGPYPLPVGPVLYVKYIDICNNKYDPEEDVQMFGHISITDYKKNTYRLFSCGKHDSRRISSSRNIFVPSVPIAPVLGGNLKFRLRSPRGTPQIFNKDKEFSLDCACKDDCEEDMCQEFPLEGGYYAKMVFNKIPRAALVYCEMFLRYERPPSCVGDFYYVHGSVKINNVVCFNRDSTSNALHMKYGDRSGFDQMSRIVFAVPVGSPLKVEYKLYHDDFEFANGKHECSPHYLQGGMDHTIYLTCNDENYCLGMKVHWHLHDSFFSYGAGYYLYFDVNWKVGLDPKRSLQGTSDNALVEVFSVFVGGVDSAPSVLCGRIVVQDNYGKCYIFARNKDFPDMYSSTEQLLERTVSLAWPDRWFAEKDFYMHLRLKDANGNPVCKGYLTWETGYNGFDRRLCDLITGENGAYAVVHYSVFKNGKKATVSVKRNENDGYSHVYGMVFAAYDKSDDYPCTYDQKCYRSIIFNRSKEDSVTVDNRFDIPLSKTHVSAPSDCKELIVDADLWVRHNMTSSYERATGVLHFEASRNGSQVKQLGCLVVTVAWC